MRRGPHSFQMTTPSACAPAYLVDVTPSIEAYSIGHGAPLAAWVEARVAVRDFVECKP